MSSQPVVKELGQEDKRRNPKNQNLKYQPEKPQTRLFWFQISLSQQSIPATFNILIILPLFPQLSISTALANMTLHLK